MYIYRFGDFVANSGVCCAGFVSGHTLVVDGGAWMWRKPLLPREAVLKASRGVESKSRAVGVGGASKL
jgi:hypothetical protein